MLHLHLLPVVMNASKDHLCKSCIKDMPHRYGWEELRLHALHQSEQYAAGKYPIRSPQGDAQYEVYKAWCSERGISNSEYVLKYVQWHAGVAFEPSLAPYHLNEGLEHWILWHHPRSMSGDTNLGKEQELKLALTLLTAEGANLSRADIICYQNVPPLRSLPTIAHSHVFLRTARLPKPSRLAIARMRSLWHQRSPWLRHLSSKSIP